MNAGNPSIRYGAFIKTEDIVRIATREYSNGQFVRHAATLHVSINTIPMPCVLPVLEANRALAVVKPNTKPANSHRMAWYARLARHISGIRYHASCVARYLTGSAKALVQAIICASARNAFGLTTALARHVKDTGYSRQTIMVRCYAISARIKVKYPA